MLFMFPCFPCFKRVEIIIVEIDSLRQDSIYFPFKGNNLFKYNSFFTEIIKNKFEIASKYSEICQGLDIKYITQKNKLMSGNYYKFTIISPRKNISELLPKVKTTTSKVYEYALGASKEIPLKHLCLPIWFNLEESVSDKVVSELKNSFSLTI